MSNTSNPQIVTEKKLKSKGITVRSANGELSYAISERTMTGLSYHEVSSQHAIPHFNVDEMKTCIFQQERVTTHYARAVKHLLITQAGRWIQSGSDYMDGCLRSPDLITLCDFFLWDFLKE